MNNTSATCPGCRERDARIAALETRLAERDAAWAGLEARVQRLETENRELRARANRNSTNSSFPPSKDPPGTQRPPPKPPSGRKRGGQPGHPGKARSPFPPEEVELQELFPDRCEGCSAELPRTASPDDPAPMRHQVIDVPEVMAFVREYVRRGKKCPGCGKITYAELPPDVPPHIVGPQLQAILGVLTGRYRVSRREAIELLVDFFGEKARLSLGEVSQLEQETSDALAGPHEEARQYVGRQPVAHADETKWGRYGWLWVLAAVAGVAVFLVHPRRAREAFLKLLPSLFAGILVTDRYGVYLCVEAVRRALCWAHLARNFQALVDRGGAAADVGKVLLEIKGRVFALWKEFEEGKFDREELRSRIGPIREEMEQMLAWGSQSEDPKAAALCADLLDLFPALWTFVEVEGVPPTNNKAEQMIRPAVLWRHVSHGCQSDRGARYCERILTAAATLRAQGRSVLGFMVQAIRALRTGGPAPSLLPTPAG